MPNSAAPDGAPVKIGFVLLSPARAPIPSTRVAALNLFPFLRRSGYEPVVLFEPDVPSERPDVQLDAERVAAEGIRIVCFQKVGGPSVLALVQALRRVGVKTVFLVCDLVDAEMAAATDATLVVTDFLRSLYPLALQPRIHVVHDGIERPEVQQAAPREDRGTPERPLNAVLVTSAYLERLPLIGLPPPWLRVTVVGRYGGERGWRYARTVQWHVRQQPGWRQRWECLRLHLHPRIRLVPWHPDGVYDELRRADLGVIPIETPASADGRVPSWQVKSENRLTLKMAVGLPVIATPIPAYEPVVQDGSNACFARSPQEWRQRLEQLRDPALRLAMGRAARESVVQRYSMAAQAQRFIAAVQPLLDLRPA